ncbi:MAG: DUF6638 family protein [Bacteroidota bacterium]
MKQLREAGLFGGGMVALSGSLAKRYNECLSLLGVGHTALKTFSIDGMGWSPEIAVEKKDNFYLNSGQGNVNAIIISPLQRDKAVHMASHSFDRDVMQAVFAAYARPIRDITKDSALVLHLDQEIDTLLDPFDLLLYKEITVTFSVLGGLLEKQMEQQAFINLFNRKNNFIDREVHQKLLESAKKYGDLRGRKLRLDPLKLPISSFHTRAFGGVFVLRETMKEMLIFEDEKMFKKAIADTAHDVLLFHKDHDELIAALVNHLILEPNMRKMVRTPRYERLRNHMFMEATKEAAYPYDEILKSRSLFKKYLSQLDVESRKTITAPERYFQKLVVDKNLKMENMVSKAYIKALHTPHSSLKEEEQELAWKLLTKIVPKDPVYLYWYDKHAFYKAYAAWPEDYREWVIDEILKNNKKYAL